MQIQGFQKTTLLDYPGFVAATIFLGGCNFRCSFCHNKGLVLTPKEVPMLDEEEVLAHLKKRKNILDGVCVSGGEPTLQPELPCFLTKIKALGFKVKLDTNGYQPQILRSLYKEKLLDYVAMDVKGAPEQYEKIVGIKNLDRTKIQESMELLMSQEVPYEFRTTVVKELHSEQNLLDVAKWIRGAKAYYLQNYKDSPEVIQPGFHGYSLEQLKEMAKHIREIVPQTQVRGEI